MTLVSRADYTLRMTKEDPWDPSWPEEFICWLDQPEILVLKKGKKTEKEMNIRPLIYEAKFVSGGPPVTDLARPLSTRQSPLKNNPEQPFSTQQPPPPEDLILSLSAPKHPSGAGHAGFRQADQKRVSAIPVPD